MFQLEDEEDHIGNLPEGNADNEQSIPTLESVGADDFTPAFDTVETISSPVPITLSSDEGQKAFTAPVAQETETIEYHPENVEVYHIPQEEHDEGLFNNDKTQMEEMLDFVQEEDTSNLNLVGKFKHYIGREFGSRSVLLFYVSHFLSSWGDSMWAFALPVIFGDMFPGTLLPMALFGLIHRMTCVILGPHMGYIVDTKPRFKVMSMALILQNLSVAITTTLILLLAIYGLTKPEKDDDDDDDTVQFVWPFTTAISIILFFASTIVGAVSELASMVSSVSRTKDWCMVIARTENIPLERMNSMMRRLDMISLIVSPVLFGLIVLIPFESIEGYKIGTIFVCVWNVISLIPEYLCLFYIYKATPALHISKLEQEQKYEEERKKEQATKAAEEGLEHELENTEEKPEEPKKEVNLKHQNIFKILYSGWKLYLQQKILLASFAYILLFITVLHHGGLLLSYLKTHHVDDVYLGIFQALSAISGLTSTFLAPYLIKRVKVFSAGVISIYLQFGCLVAGMGFFVMFHFWNEKLYFTVFLFLGCLVLSRLGLYAFDLAEIQIMQQLVDQKDSGIINATEGSLTKVADLVVFMSALFFSTPQNFIFLAAGSLACVGLAALLYTFWYLRNKKHMSQWLQDIEDEERRRSQQK